MRRVDNSERMPATRFSTPKRRTRRVRGDMSPTSNAELQFKVTEQEPHIRRAMRPRLYTVDPPEKEPEATCSAEAEIRYREARGRFTVPPKQAGHLLNLMTCMTGIGGVLLICAVILRFYDGAPAVLTAVLCGLCVIVIAGLACITIFRNRS
jgi:hypothetical protein